MDFYLIMEKPRLWRKNIPFTHNYKLYAKPLLDAISMVS